MMTREFASSQSFRSDAGHSNTLHYPRWTLLAASCEQNSTSRPLHPGVVALIFAV